MILKNIKRIKRAPVSAIAVLLFAAIISVIICTLQASNEAELRNYEETWKTVPITVTVTDLSGTNNGKLIIDPWVLDLFIGDKPVKFYDLSVLEDPNDYFAASKLRRETEPIKLSLTEYVKDVQIQMRMPINTINGTNFTSAGSTPQLYGITTINSDKQLLPENGCQITWYEGYDESIFAGEDMLCIIPEEMAERYDNGGVVDLYFSNTSENPIFVTLPNGEQIAQFPKKEYNCSLKIVGTYTVGDGKSIYCPYTIFENITSKLEMRRMIYSLGATLADNSRLDEFREVISFCFREPSPDAEKVDWFASIWNEDINGFYEKYYPYALDINDENLFDITAILEDSIKFNRTVTLIVVVLSVISGFLVGFLMIRRRKRDILLMRMVGESNARVYVGFALEQMIFIILGIAIGGAYYKWNPINNLAIFAVAYFIALSLALVIFMSKKLINNVKEDE
ncbi:MAG: hypothetical protein J6S14_05130 [Clostridia bacterium]|nr:hypothetical protein [Clostridia bacterium]